MTLLCLVRHGQTDWNAENRWLGHRDIPLNAVGLTQAEAVARAFRGVPVDRVFTSDLARADRTARVIAEAVGAPLEAVPELRERCFGQWEGRTTAELTAEVPGQMEAWGKDRLGFAPPGGESWNEFALRAVAGIEDLAERHAWQRLVIVSHYGPVKEYLDHILGLPRGVFGRYQLDNASISVVRTRADATGTASRQVAALNITGHLDGALPS